jgi:hypothetical protein
VYTAWFYRVFRQHRIINEVLKKYCNKYKKPGATAPGFLYLLQGKRGAGAR